MIERRWASSTKAHSPNDLPEKCGWLLNDGNYVVQWEGEATPVGAVCDDGAEADLSEESEGY